MLDRSIKVLALGPAGQPSAAALSAQGKHWEIISIPDLLAAEALDLKLLCLDSPQGLPLVLVADPGDEMSSRVAPHLARKARALALPTLALLARPPATADSDYQHRARWALAALEELVDAPVVLNGHLDGAALGHLLEMLSTGGLISLDLNDLRRLLRRPGQFVIAAAEAHGPDRALQAARRVLGSLARENLDLSTAPGLLVHISGSIATLTSDEYNAIQEEIYSLRPDDEGEDSPAFIKFGLHMNDALGERLQVIIAAIGPTLDRVKSSPPYPGESHGNR